MTNDVFLYIVLIPSFDGVFFLTEVKKREVLNWMVFFLILNQFNNYFFVGKKVLQESTDFNLKNMYYV